MRDAEAHYEKLIDSLLDALGAEVTKWGDCPNCSHRVPVTFADIRARTHAIEVLIDQDYGRPATTVTLEQPEGPSIFAALNPEQKRAELAKLQARLEEL